MIGEVPPERSGWRDEALSRRHRKWGLPCPALDVDFLLVEYRAGKPKALVEYKHANAKPGDRKNGGVLAIRELADRSGVPFLACRYACDFSWFKVTPLNDFARKHIPKQKWMPERGYLELLYSIRGSQLPDSIKFDDDGKLIE